MTRKRVLTSIIVLALGVTALSAVMPSADPNTFIILFYLELLVPVVGCVAALRMLRRHPASAPGMLGISLYGLALAAVWVVLPPRWFATDNTGLGMQMMGFLLGVVAVPLLLVSAILVLRQRQGQALVRALCLAAGACITTIGVLLVRGPGDWASASPTIRLYSFPLIVMAVALCLLILDLTGSGRRDGARRVQKPW